MGVARKWNTKIQRGVADIVRELYVIVIMLFWHPTAGFLGQLKACFLSSITALDTH